MKRSSFLSLLLLTLSVCAFAQSDRTMLKLRLSDHSLISVDLDGRFIDQQTTALTLDGIRPGFHHLEVYADAGPRRRPVRIYTGTLRLQPATVNVGILDIYDRGLRLRTRPMDDRDYAEATPDDRRGRGRNYDYPRNDSENMGNAPDYRNDQDKNGDDVYGNNRRDEQDAPPAENTESGYGSFPHGHDDRANDANIGISQRDMDDLHSRVAEKITDSDKEKLLKNVLQGRNPSTEQVREMLSWFSFDSTRLSFAKWEYSQVADPANYGKLEDAFSFDASREEFTNSIGH